MAQGVQFKGEDKVLQAYINRGIPSFAIFLGSQLILPYPCDNIETGRAALSDFLQAISEGTNAVYTLKVYEDLDEKGKIKDKTPSDGSFNFQLWGQNMSVYDGQQARINGMNEMVSRLSAIEKKLGDGPEKEPTIYDHVLDFCETDVGKIVAPQLIGGVLRMLGMANNQPVFNPPNLGAIRGIPESDQLTNAIEVLKQYDPKLPEHLFKLAQLAKADPGQFAMLIMMIDKI